VIGLLFECRNLLLEEFDLSLLFLDGFHQRHNKFTIAERISLLVDILWLVDTAEIISEGLSGCFYFLCDETGDDFIFLFRIHGKGNGITMHILAIKCIDGFNIQRIGYRAKFLYKGKSGNIFFDVSFESSVAEASTVGARFRIWRDGVVSGVALDVDFELTGTAEGSKL